MCQLHFAWTFVRQKAIFKLDALLFTEDQKQQDVDGFESFFFNPFGDIKWTFCIGMLQWMKLGVMLHYRDKLAVSWLNSYFKKGRTINSDKYLAQLVSLKLDIVRKWRHMMKNKGVFHQDKAQCHKSMKMMAEIQELHMAYSYFYLFVNIKEVKFC